MSRDLKSKAVFAHAVVATGVVEKCFIVGSIMKDIAWMGFARVKLKSGNEPAILKVVQEFLKALKVEVFDQAGGEHPPPYDGLANGGIEADVNLDRGMVGPCNCC